MMRQKTREIRIGDVIIGNNHPIVIQSMTNVRAKDIEATCSQIERLAQAGAEIVRIAIVDEDDARAIALIKKRISVPLVADIHFDYRLALLAADAGVDKLRINPGNIKNPEHIRLIVEKCRERHIPIRIGINGGSLDSALLEKYGGCTVDALIESMANEIKLLEDFDFHDIVLSIKTSNIPMLIEANTRLAAKYDYPIHLGLTEAGTATAGTVKSSYALGTLINQGIGDTIRVSLTGDPAIEIPVAREILKMCNQYNGISLVSCPTCGRTNYKMLDIITEIEPFLATIRVPLKVAIMGCVVNGPGEARDADIGIAGGKNQAVLFKRGEIVCNVPQDQIVNVLKQEITEMAKQFGPK